MALTDGQKMALDDLIRKHFNELANVDRFTTATLKELAEELNFNITPTSFRSALNRVVGRQSDYTLHSVGNKPVSYRLIEEKWKLNGKIFKEKSVLHFINEKEKYGDVTYDFATQKWSVSLENVLKSMQNYSWIWYIFAHTELWVECEWMFNYTKNLDDIYDIIRHLNKDDYKSCPDGYIKFLQETGTEFDFSSLKEYVTRQKYGTIGYNLLNSGINENDIKWLVDNSLIKSFLKCLTYNVKSGYLFDSREVYQLLDYWRQASTVADKIVLIDENKSLRVNIEMLRDIIEKGKNEVLARQLQKLNFINGLRRNNLIVIVPQNQEEKRDEGRQQNNCVGHYYDDSILRGENYIYFIRKVDTPKKSYVTCRFNKNYEETVEFRAVNNNRVTDQEVYYFIKLIDKRIKEQLAQQQKRRVSRLFLCRTACARSLRKPSEFTIIPHRKNFIKRKIKKFLLKIILKFVHFARLTFIKIFIIIYSESETKQTKER